MPATETHTMVVSDTQEVVITNEFGKWVVSLLSHEDAMSHPIVVPMFRNDDVQVAYAFAYDYLTLQHKANPSNTVAPHETTKTELIRRINRFRPFELGDDPAAWRQAETVDRVIAVIDEYLPEDGVNIDAPLNEIWELL